MNIMNAISTGKPVVASMILCFTVECYAHDVAGKNETLESVARFIYGSDRGDSADDMASLGSVAEIEHNCKPVDDTPYLHETFVSNRQIVYKVNSGILSKVTKIKDFNKYTIYVNVDQQTGSITRIYGKLTQHNYSTLPFPDAQAAAERLTKSGPEFWVSMIEDPAVPFVDAIRPLHRLAEGGDARILVHGLSRAVEWVAQCVKMQYGPMKEEQKVWVFHVRGIPTPVEAMPNLAIGFYRCAVDETTNRWLHSANVLGPVVTNGTLMELGLMDKDASDVEAYRIRQRYRSVAGLLPSVNRWSGWFPPDKPSSGEPANAEGGCAPPKKQQKTMTHETSGVPFYPYTGPNLVSVHLNSQSDGILVRPMSLVNWEIRLEQVEEAHIDGLAGLVVNLIQDPTNPESAQLQPGTVVPPEMSGFVRPAGISNPGPGGYGGTEIDGNLMEIGGLQNTSGVPLNGGAGQDIDVDADVGKQTGGQMITAGAFNVPSQQGEYHYFIDSARANVLIEINAPPGISRVRSAEVISDQDSVTIHVACTADINLDGFVNLADVTAFIDAFQAGDPIADLNGDGLINFADVIFFNDHMAAGC